MTTLTPSDCRTLFRKLSQEQRDYFLSTELADRVSDLARSNNLDDDGEGQLTLVVGYAILGAIPENRIEQELEDRFDVEKEIIHKLKAGVELLLESVATTQKDSETAPKTTGHSPVRLDMPQQTQPQEAMREESPVISPQPPIPPAFSPASNNTPVVLRQTVAQTPAVPAVHPTFATPADNPPHQAPAPDQTPAPKPNPAPSAVDLSSLRSAAASALSSSRVPAPTPAGPTPVFIRQEGEVRPIQMDARIATPTQNAAYSSRDQISSLSGNSATSIKEKSGPASIEFGRKAGTPPLAAAVIPPTPAKNIYGSVVPTAPKPMRMDSETFGSDFTTDAPSPAPTFRPTNSPEKQSFWSSFVDMVSPIKKAPASAPPTPNRVDIAPSPIQPPAPPPHH
jgi:hypothetical protein